MGVDQAASGELAEQARVLPIFVERAPVAIAMFDTQMRYLAYSERWREEYGLQGQVLYGRSHYEVFPEIPERWREVHRRVLAGATERCEEDRFERADGSVQWLWWECRPWRTGTGEIGGIIMFTADITRRKQAEEQLVEAERARAELAEHLGSEISHRVRNNLAMMASILQIQLTADREGPSAPALREAISRIRTFASIHEAMYPARLDAADLLDVLQRVAAATRQVFSAPAQGAQIEVRGQPLVCSAGDATNLAVIANELLTNALKYGGPDREGRRRVEVTLEVQGGQVALRVWNSGQPVPADFDATRQRGVGLRLADGLLTSHYHGTFSLRPAGEGSLAELVVPWEELARPTG